MTIEVPVIDLRRPRSEILGTIDRACEEWGFFQIVGHDIGPDLISAVMRETQGFFQASEQLKRSVQRSATNVWGFYDQELTKNTRDWKEVFDVGPAQASGPLAGSMPLWPDLPDFREVLEAFATACERVAFHLLSAIAENLGQPPKALHGHFAKHTSFLRLNYYPICPDPAPVDSADEQTEGNLGINRHTDAGAITVLLQDEQPGLQVYREGRWTTVSPHPDALVINIGDIVQVWSNDRYVAPLHRVIANSSSDRFSLPYFFNPDYRTNYAPLSEPARYRPINWGEFRAGRAAGDYADYGEEIQIAHFKIEKSTA